jgi:hypothetical protein
MKLITLKPIDNRKYEVVLNVEIPSNINTSVDVFVKNELKKLLTTENNVNDDNMDKINKLTDDISKLNTTIQSIISGFNTELTKIKEDVKILKNKQ